MSKPGEVTLAWGNDEHPFRLAMAQLRDLQTKCDAGPLQILDRLQGRTWRIDDVRETLRLGLIGGGMDVAEAKALVVRNIDEQEVGLLTSVLVAQLALMASLSGPRDDAGKAKGAKKRARRTSSPSANSSEQPAL